MTESSIPSPGPSSRFSRKAAWCWGVLIILLLIGTGTAVFQWKKDRAGMYESRDKVFQGISSHWDQSAIPVSMKCGACHEKEFREWAASDHAWAFRKLDAKWDAEAFHGMSLPAHGSVIHFTTEQGGKRRISDEQMAKKWDAAWAVGRVPLVQYIVPSKDGGYHTPSAAWDVNRKEWFDIFGSDQRSAHDWGHWLGRGMNWNSQCAWCHMSDFAKNYDSKSDVYHSTWAEPGVTCIQCHGPLLDKPEQGTGCMISTKRKFSPAQVKDNCASCHARRDEFDHSFKVGDAFDNHFQLVLPVQPGVFWPNGMQRDEDYCETGLRLSKMGRSGVTCLDCHQPHTGGLKLPQEDNALCLRCHATGEKVNGTPAPVINMAKHSPCPPSSKGGRCVECHMPESPYMARDPRRDHSFNSPDPFMSVELGIPNACTMCHKNKDDSWAAGEVDKYYGKSLKMAETRNRTRAVEFAYRGDAKALHMLLTEYPAQKVGAWRATLLELMADWSDSPDVGKLAVEAMKDPDPLVRAASAKILGLRGDPSVSHLLDDSFKVVRLQAEWALRDQLPQGGEKFLELVKTALHQADQPTGAMKMAQIEIGRKNVQAADQWFSKALKWDSTSSVVRRDYSVFLAAQGRTQEAVTQMKEAIKTAPQDAGLWFLLALGQQENGQDADSLSSFDEAIRLAPSYVRAIYNRALLHNKLGNLESALSDLENCSKLDAANPDIPYTIGIIQYHRGVFQQAVAAAAEALRRDPNHAGARELLERASRRPSSH